MAKFHLAVIPVGKVDAEDLEQAMTRMAKGLRCPVELRGSLPIPRVAEDHERGQHRALTMMAELRSLVPQLHPGKLVGSDDPSAKLPPRADAYIFVTDVDLFTAKTDGVFSALIRSKGLALVSLRRVREAFYRRPADLGKQRARLVKELLRMAGRLQGLPECKNPECALAATKSPLDIDTKNEVYCRPCSQWLFEGKIQV